MSDYYYDECPQRSSGCSGKLILFVLLLAAAYFVYSGSIVGKAKVSWYWPPLLGTNCGRVVGNECVSATASGEPWQALVGKNAIACPAQFKFGALVLMDLGEAGWQVWTCKDRGGAIVDRGGNVYWVDMLVQKPVVPFGTEVTAVFINIP
ncbi:MAG: hypothetical protein WBP54_10290 [Pelodictyon phaeoclathratiforme]